MRMATVFLGSGLLATTATTGAANPLNCTLKPGFTMQASRAGICGFDPTRRSFAGSPVEQAQCLLRTVEEGRTLGGVNLSRELAELVGKPTNLSLQIVRAFLARTGAAEADLGGSVIRGIGADYFIIHDTSTPNCSEHGVSARSCPSRGEFPHNRDDASWIDNATFNGYKASDRKIAHVMTNRVGQSMTMVDFARPISTTKFESCVDAPHKVGLFVGIENIQPRIGRPAVPAAGKKANDLVAPMPGFTASQYDRLALLYIVASARRGTWLIPAYHAVLDQYYAEGHDDPQHFDISAFSEAVQRVLGTIRGS